jgi:hypothetical protein
MVTLNSVEVSVDAVDVAPTKLQIPGTGEDPKLIEVQVKILPVELHIHGNPPNVPAELN